MTLLFRMAAVLACTLLISAADAQSDKFGDEFLDWVKKDLPKQSEAFCRSDYRNKWHHYFQVVLDQKLKYINTIDSVLNAVHREAVGFERFYDSVLHRGGLTLHDSLALALQRHESARRHLFRLNGLGFYFQQLERMSSEMDSVNTRGVFIRSGMGHSGREMVLQSVLKLGNQLATTSSGRYAPYFGMTARGDSVEFKSVGYTDDVTTALTLGQALLTAYEAAAMQAGNQTMAGYYGYGSGILSFILFAYQIYQIERYHAQLAKVEEGMKLMEKKVITPEQMYAISSAIYKELHQERLPFILQGDHFIDTLKHHWQQTTQFNHLRYQQASAILTREKIMYLEQNYNVERAVTDLFEQELIGKVAGYALRSYNQIQQLKRDSLVRLRRDVKSFSRVEVVEEHVLHLRDLIRQWKTNTKLIPVYSFLDGIREQLDRDSADLDALRSHLVRNDSLASFFTAEAKLPELPATLFPVAKSGVVKKAGYPSFTAARQEEPSSVFYYFRYNGHSYTLGLHPDMSYQGTLNNGGGYPVYDVLGSPVDGGYFSDVRRKPLGMMEIGKARQDINRRIELMKQKEAELVSLSEEWQQRNAQVLGQRVMGLSNTYARHPVGSTAVYRQWAQSGAQPGISDYRPPLQGLPSINPQGVPGIEGYSAPGSLMDYIKNDLQYQVYKNQLQSLQVKLRVMTNYSEGRVDPVFNTREDFELHNQVFNQVSRYASVFSNGAGSTCMRYPVQCTSLKTQYLDNMKLLRYYAMGWITEATLNELSVQLNPEMLAYEMTQMLDEFSMTCHDADANGDTPCNMYVVLALKKVYGIDDFYTPLSNGRRGWWPANRIFTHLKNGAPEWKALGPATNQVSLDDAAFYASQGRAVVAVSSAQGHGHIALVMPSLAIHTSTTPAWHGYRLPMVTSFFFHKPESTVYYKPISHAWSSPQGVFLYVRDY